MKIFPLRLDDEFHAALKDKAHEQKMSIHKYILSCIETGFEYEQFMTEKAVRTDLYEELKPTKETKKETKVGKKVGKKLKNLPEYTYICTYCDDIFEKAEAIFYEPFHCGHCPTPPKGTCEVCWKKKCICLKDPCQACLYPLKAVKHTCKKR